MRINLTLFIQVINFGVTYWFLNWFMFRPVINFLKEKKNKEEKTKKNLEKKEQNLLEIEKKKHQDLDDFKIRMKKEYRIAPTAVPEIPSEIICKIDKKKAEKLTVVAKKILLKKVPHVD